MKVDLNFIICNLRNKGYKPELLVDMSNKPCIMLIEYKDYASYFGAKNYVEEYYPEIEVRRNDRLMLIL